MGITAKELSAKMTATCGIPMHVAWSFRLCKLICTRVDGNPLTPDQEVAFDSLLRLEQLTSA